MAHIIEVVAAFTRLPETLQRGAKAWLGAVTIWPTKYDGGSDTGSAAIKVGTGKNAAILELYLNPETVETYAGITEPGEAFAFSLAVNSREGNPQFEVQSIEKRGKRALSTVAALEVAAPVLLGVSGGAAEILLDAEAESAMRVSAPPGMAFHPELGGMAGALLPAMTLHFERRLQPGDGKVPCRARAVRCDERMLVSAHPVADLATLSR